MGGVFCYIVQSVDCERKVASYIEGWGRSVGDVGGWCYADGDYTCLSRAEVALIVSSESGCVTCPGSR